MSHSTHRELNDALDADAAKLEAMGQDPGPTLEDVYAHPEAPDAADYDYPYDDDDDDDAWDELMCSMGPDGLCGQAGSEYCDFECPTMRASHE